MGLLHRGAQPRPIAVASRWADGTAIVDYHPRLKAIEWLRGKIADGKAGVDPFDESLFIVIAADFERTWAYRALELVGQVIVRGETADGGQRLKALVEADVRIELGLDSADAPTMVDEPLASRGVASSATAIMDAVFEALPDAAPVLQAVPAPVELTPGQKACRDAKAAYDERQVH